MKGRLNFFFSSIQPNLEPRIFKFEIAILTAILKCFQTTARRRSQQSW
jgi:hypothetical protein